jgi:hypothetical protein
MKRFGVFALLAFTFLALVSMVSAEPRLAKNFVAHLDGGNEVPEVHTFATGQAIFQLNPAEDEINYKLIVANIENVIQAHIHLGVAGVNGPVVAFLVGPFAPDGGRFDGVIAEGTITAADVIGPLSGDLSSLIANMRSGATYVNVHTGDFPPGEIRGQIRSAGLSE